MRTVEPASIQEATDRMVKIIESTYAKADLKQVDNNTSNLNSEGRTLLLSLIKNFMDLFDGTLGYWATEPVNLYLKPHS